VLSLSGVSASYGSVPAVGNVSIEVGEGEAVGLLGANGAGKSTTLRAISGLVRLTSGTISFLGTDIASLPPYKITELGIAHVPEGRQVFPEMTVQENLEIGAYVPRAKAERSRSLDLVFGIFPVLAERRRQLAGSMSGGEQQMLTLARALMTAPRILLIDEPSVGLSPLLVIHIINQIRELKERYGLTVLMAEQNFHQAIRIADRGYVIVHGRIEYEGASRDELSNNELIRKLYMGL
jgi:branched-chain amino acid transport system ATP-binding protein